MRRLVVVLGAGASVSAGLPTLAGIFDDPSVRDYLAGDGADFMKFMEDKVWGPRDIQPGERWKSLNLEEVLTMLRQWQFRPKATGGRERNPYSPLNHKKNGRLQRQLLACVYHSVFVGKSGREARDYNRLIQLADSECDHVTWVSFNWDALLEQAFYWQFYRENRLPRCHPDLHDWNGADDKHLLLKLHGSVTWFFDASGRVFYVPYGKTKSRNLVEDHWCEYLKSAADAPRPMIAEPSFLKHEDLAERPFLLSQWSLFDEAIKKADLVLVIGYSMPEGDAMAKQALLTAVEREAIGRFVVVDPDRQVMERYTRILGTARFTGCECRFGEFLNAYPSLLPFLQ